MPACRRGPPAERPWLGRKHDRSDSARWPWLLRLRHAEGKFCTCRRGSVRMKSTCLFLSLLLSVSAAQLTEGLPGKPLPVTPSKNVKGMLEIHRDGDVVVIPRSERPPTSVSLRSVSEAEAGVIWKAVGGSLSLVPSPSDAKVKEGPFYPLGMRQRGESGSAICLFEVTTNGHVGRIFRVGSGSDQFFKECVRALQNWRFEKQNRMTYRAIEFTAKTQNPRRRIPEPPSSTALPRAASATQPADTSDAPVTSQAPATHH